VLLGNGDGSFQAQQTYPTGTTPEAFFVGFFDKSLLSDIIVFNGDSTVSPLSNVTVSTMPPQMNVPIVGTGTHTVQASYFPDPGSIYSGASATVSGLNAYQAQVSLSPSVLYFGAQAVGTTSGAGYVQVMNAASSPVTLSGITAPSSDFTVTGSTCGATLAAQSNCSFLVAFTPQSTGAKSPSMTINASGTNLPLSLNGTGVAAGVVSLSPSVLYFGSQTVGTSSGVGYVQVLNATSSPVTLSGITAPTSDFTVTGSTCGRRSQPRAIARSWWRSRPRARVPSRLR